MLFASTVAAALRRGSNPDLYIDYTKKNKKKQNYVPPLTIYSR